MGAMIELRPSAELSEGELLFGLDSRAESDAVSAVTSALSAALRANREDGTPEEAAALPSGILQQPSFQTVG